VRCLIAGCGWLGEALGIALASRGDRAWGLRREIGGLPPGIEGIAADLADPTSLAALPAALDAVVFAAAPERGDAASYQRTYAEGLANLLEALPCSGRPAPRLILLSSTSVYGQSGGEWVDESSPCVPADFRGEAMLRAEEVARSSGLPAIALRLGGLYGPGRTSLVDAVRDGRAVAAGAARFTNRIHRDDAVGAILHLLDLPAERVAEVYIAVDQEPAEHNEVLRWLAARLDVELPGPPAGADDMPERVRAETSKRCSSARLRQAGYRFRFPSYRDGYAALLAVGCR
jgi:nucleoside-diphosphate-sugar epimerase